MLTIISRSKGNQTIKFGQLIEYDMKNLSLEKSYTDHAADIPFSHPFVKNQNWAYLSINILKFYTVCFNCMPS